MGGVRYRGQVLSIDRANRLLTARLWGEVIEGVRYSSHPESRAPWPLCDAWFAQDGGVWRCVRPIGHRRIIFHDDFTRVVSGSGYGDTPWNTEAFGDGSATASAATGVAAVGAVALTGTASSGGRWLYKDSDALIVPEHPEAVIASFRLMSSATNALGIKAGFAYDGALSTDAAIVRSITIGGGVGLSFQLLSLDAGGLFAGADVVEGTTPTQNVWYWVEVLVADSVACAWIDGNGPSMLFSPNALGQPVTPVAGDSLTVILSGGSTTASGYYDVASCSQVTLSGAVPRLIAA